MKRKEVRKRDKRKRIERAIRANTKGGRKKGKFRN